MLSVFANAKVYGATAVLFGLATIVNIGSGYSAVGESGLRLNPAGIEMKSGPTMPPDPYDELPPEGDNKRQTAAVR